MRLIGQIIFIYTMISSSALAQFNSSVFDPKAHPEYFFHGGEPPIWGYQSVQERVPDSILGFREHPDVKIHDIMRTRSQIIWDIEMQIDPDGTRHVPQDNLGRRKYFLAFFGCSFTLGTGLNDNETFPYFLAKKVENYHVYNMGIGSSATNMLLAQMEDSRLREILKENQGIFIYVPIWGHVGRANGYLEESQWMGMTPFYSKDKMGVLSREGTLDSARPLRTMIYTLFRFVKNLVAPNWRINWPPVAQSHYQYTCDLVVEAAKKFNKKFPGSRFLVVNHPLSPIGVEVTQCLSNNKVTVIQIPWEKRPEDFIPLEGHPSKTFNEVFADRLIAVLGTNWPTSVLL